MTTLAAVALQPESNLPPRVEVRLDEDVRSYFRKRLEQHTHDRYAGIELQKFPEDLRVYEQLIWESRANVVIEIGTLHGASALWFRDRLRTFARYGRIAAAYRVISVDVDHSHARAALDAADPRWAETIELVTADIRHPATADLVENLLLPSDRCFVVEDSAHVNETTRAALDAFASAVPDGGYFVVEDGVVDVEELRFPEYPRGVLPAISEWLATERGGAFAQRRDLERYGLSCHPGGFLQRVRSDPSGSDPSGSVADDLRAELESPPGWMYPWSLGPGLSAPADPIRIAVHETRAKMIERPLREALARGGDNSSAIDLGCNEGWFAHMALRHGAHRAVGIDIRPVNVRRARLVRDHLGISAEQLQLEQRDVLALDAVELGEFDVVLLLGLIYHLENPGGALRAARRLAKPGGAVIVETQLTRQAEPILHGWGTPDSLEVEAASFAARLEHDEDDPLASAGGVVSLIPNRPALEKLMSAAGFAEVRWLDAPRGAEPQYASGDRGIVVGHP